MAFFALRERTGLSNSVDADVAEQSHAFVRRDLAPLRRPQSPDYAPRRQRQEPDLAANVGSQLQQVGESALAQVDNLIADLQMQRERLLSESARMQRDILKFAQLSQSTMQSTKIIAESLTLWNKVEAAPNTKMAVEKVVGVERLERAAEADTGSHEGPLNENGRTTVRDNPIANPIDQNPVPIEQPA